MQRIYDTRERKKVDLQLHEPGKVGIYGCGVTVYDLCHVGHARTLVAYDVIARHLRQGGLQVRMVRNITDVDDKIIRKGHAEGRTADEVAKFYADAMAADMAALGIATPDVEPRATRHIAEMIDVIRRLEERGLAYAAEGDVYYSVSSFPAYGALSGQSIDDLQAGARIEVGEHKRSPLDFTLWKGAKPGEPQWPSPWGPGRPGWHIECSAMAHKYLGDTFDIHCGGSDLIFPHHENEIAQSEGAFGSFARHWMHSGMVNFGGEKMSKSLGNVVTIRRVAETHDLEALRLLLISVHYRSPVSFTIGRSTDGQPVYPDLDEAETRLDYFYRTLERLDAFLAPLLAKLPDNLPPSELAKNAGAAMDDDFNTAAAIGHLYDAFVLANKLLDDPKAMPKLERQQTLAVIARDARRVGATLGIMLRPPSEFLLARRDRLCVRRKIDRGAVEARLADRATARAAKDFGRADEIRDELKATGVELMDTPAGTTWRVAS
jgi:cysteinyl-tRNA synthetase